MDKYFNSHKVKYFTLDKLIQPIKRSYPIKTVNLFINLDDLYHRYHVPFNNEVLLTSGSGMERSMIANILNLCAHYREFFVREGWNTTVYVYYTSLYTGEFRNELYIENYRKHYFDIVAPSNQDFYAINSCFHSCLDLMTILFQYINGVYLVNSNQIEPSVMPYYIQSKIHPADWNFILTRDSYDYQYIAYPKWSILYAHSQNVTLITRESVWRSVIDLEKLDPPPAIINFPPEFYQIALYVIGNKYRNIPKLRKVSWRSIFGVLQQLQEETLGMSPAQCDAFMVPILGGKDTAQKFHNNIAVTNVKYQADLISQIDEAKLLNSFIDIDDTQNLNELARVYFADHPINLTFLLSNIKVESKPVYNTPFV